MSVTKLIASNDQLRRQILDYMYRRNANATSARGKRGAAIKISDLKKSLKTEFGMSQPQVVSNLNYLISQGWIAELPVEKSIRTPSGAFVPSTTVFYGITASGIDKIEGKSEFTPSKFDGINIRATGQNIITVGDGNEVNAEFEAPAEYLSRFSKTIRESEQIPPEKQCDMVAQINTIQSQLATTSPNSTIIRQAWQLLKTLETYAGFGVEIVKVAEHLERWIS